jgi:uncharacterized protein YerC
MAKIKDRDFQNKHRTEWQDFLWDRFLEKFSEIKTEDRRKAINTLFSNYEKQLITKRLAALILLREGKGSKEISDLLWLSWSTISTLKKTFLTPGVYKSQRSFKRTKKPTNSSLSQNQSSWLETIFKDVDLWEIIKNPPRPRGMGLKSSHL